MQPGSRGLCRRRLYRISRTRHDGSRRIFDGPRNARTDFAAGSADANRRPVGQSRVYTASSVGTLPCHQPLTISVLANTRSRPPSSRTGECGRGTVETITGRSFTGPPVFYARVLALYFVEPNTAAQLHMPILVLPPNHRGWICTRANSGYRSW